MAALAKGATMAANPCGTHVRIAATMRPEQAESGSIGRQSGDADGAHGECAGQGVMHRVPDGRSDHVFGTGTRWPDSIVAAVMAGLALQGARIVVRQSLSELRRPLPFGVLG
jgi:hypothetical protein